MFNGVKITEKVIAFKSILSSFAEATPEQKVMKLNLVEIKDNQQEKFLISFTSGEESELLSNVKPVVDELSTHGKQL